MQAPLAGVSVVEMGGAAVAYAGKLFADLGAHVTRVEPLQVEASGAETSGSERGSLALYLNAHKTSVSLDAPITARSESLAELFARSAIFLHGPAHENQANSLTPEGIAAEFPQLVVVSITPFGLKGEARTWAADDLTLQAYGGISIGIGLPGEPPLKLPGEQTAFQAGLSAAIAALGALFSKRSAIIDVASADVWAAFYSGVDVALAHFGRHKKHRAGHRVSGQPYPRTLFRCKDGYFAIQCGESRHWQSFLRMIEREDLAANPLFANRFKANDEYGDACDALIGPWFLVRAKDQILRACLEHKIPGAPVYDIAEVVEHPQLRGRNYFVAVDTPGGRVTIPGDPFVGLTRSTDGAIRPAHNAAVPTRPTQRDTAASKPGLLTSSKLRPLAGVRVVDFGWVWAGAVPGHILADMGAEVIKIESASPLDYMRQGRPIVGKQKDPEQNPMFHNVNRGKLSFRVKLDHPEAGAVLKDLIAKSDVVIENFSPGVMEKFGLAYAELQRVRSDLVMCSMSAVGQHGPLRGIRTYATMIASLAGLDSLVGYPGSRVLGSQSSYADPNASLHASVGILAALWRRQQTGEGAYIDLSQWEAAVGVMGEQIADYGSDDRVPAPSGTHHPIKAPHGHYPAAGDDRWIAISVATDDQWRALRTALGDPESLSSNAFATKDGRQAHRAKLDQSLARETIHQDAYTLAAALAGAGVPAAPLLEASELATNAHFRQRQLFEMVAHPALESVPVYRLPWHIDSDPIPIARRAPLLGEHNDYALKELLDYAADRVAALRASGLFT